MAENTENLIPLLTPEQVARLRANKKKLVEVRAAMSRLKALGMDTKVVEDKIDWADNVQDTLLKDFVDK